MRSLVVYESMFGNTRAVALAIAEELGAFGPVEAREVGDAPPSTAGFDLVVVGGPIHAWAMSRPSTRAGAADDARAAGVEPVSRGPGIREWLAGLPRSAAGQAAATFDTAVRVPGFVPQGSAARPAARRLRRLGFLPAAPPEHFFVAAKTGPVEDGEVARARQWADALAGSRGAPCLAAR